MFFLVFITFINGIIIKIDLSGRVNLNYELIALDMDGTLLNDEKKITEKTLSYIKEAKEKELR